MILNIFIKHGNDTIQHRRRRRRRRRRHLQSMDNNLHVIVANVSRYIYASII